MWIWSRVNKDKFSLDLKFVLFVFKMICCCKHAKMFLLLYQRPTTVLQRKGHQNLKWGMRHSTSKHNIYCRTQCLNIAVNNFYLTNYLFIFKKRELQRRVNKPQLMCFMRQGKTIGLKKACFFSIQWVSSISMNSCILYSGIKAEWVWQGFEMSYPLTDNDINLWK